MGISFFSNYAIDQVYSGRFNSAEDAFEHCYKKGIRFGDLIARLEEYPMHLHCEVMRSVGIEPNCLILIDNFADFDLRKRRAVIALYKEKIDTMEKLNIPLLMGAPLVKRLKTLDEIKRTNEFLIEGFTEIVEYAKGAGITVALENQSLHSRPDSHIKDLKYILDCVPELKFILDNGNFWCIGEDELEALEKFKDKLVNIHCKDWIYSEYGEYFRPDMPAFRGAQIGAGGLSIKDLAEKLSLTNYKGNVTMELNFDYTADEFDNSIEYMSNIFGI